MKKGRVNAEYDEQYTLENRTFPTKKAALLVLILVIQIGFIVAAFHYEPQPQDIIREYEITVTPQEDGSLDILYRFLWEPMDAWEDLTWIEIGMANGDYTVYADSVSDTIMHYTPYSYDGEVYLELDLDRAYTSGEVLEFSFMVNQRRMLHPNGDSYYYRFVPGWFNATPVDKYTFRWAADDRIQFAADARLQDDYYVWEGSLACGEYVHMNVDYKPGTFDGCATAPYQLFDDSGAYNELEDNRNALITLAIVVAVLLVAVQVWVIDSVVSYHRGRGFLAEHGYYVHAYGRSNPYYIRARNRYISTHSGGSGHRGGGGCACACACACAGGGRAGCSQKDTYAPLRQSTCE